MPSRTRWKWGILFGGDNLSMADLLRYGKMADDAVADSVWTAEVWRDAFVPLTAMASVVQRARVGTAATLVESARAGPASHWSWAGRVARFRSAWLTFSRKEHPCRAPTGVPGSPSPRCAHASS